MGPRYTRLASSLSSHSAHPSSSAPTARQLLLTTLLLLSLLTSFLLGRHSSASSRTTSSAPLSAPPPPAISLPYAPYTFTYNRTFGSAPSPETARAWASLFPSLGGYLTHPTVAPKRGAVGVFHQLHCLNALRHALYTFYDAATATTTSSPALDPSTLPMEHSPPHVRHCIDLLRQALMCRPDLVVEVKNEELGGVTGFGTEHVCADWSSLVGFVGEWEGELQVSEGGGGHHHHGGHGGGHEHGR